MNTRNLSLVFAIPGFFYSATLLFIFLMCFGIYDLINILNELSDYLPYLSIVVFFFSFVVGMIGELFLQTVVFKITKKSYDGDTDLNISTLESSDLGKVAQGSYQKLLLLRHMIIGPFLLLVSLVLWIWSSDYQYKSEIIYQIAFACGTLSLISFIAYLIYRVNHKKLKEGILKFISEKYE